MAVFTKKNLKYISADVVGGVFAHGFGILAFLIITAASAWLIAIFTFISASLGFLLGNVSTYALWHKNKARDILAILRANVYSTCFSGIIMVTFLYYNLTTEFLPVYALPSLSYAIAGFPGFLLRHLVNVKNGLFLN